ncbi:hypothetical protein [Arthrobacter sp. NPDC057013]|uniref:hypothetical protein n=1 Tax=Arthrobacter sp. NPDC057013 TaxID=3345999 RepID=UPI003643AF73
MNDFHELRTGSRRLHKYFEKLRPSLQPEVAEAMDAAIREHAVDAHSAYIVSASRDRNSLTLWRNYGKHSISYSVGLDPGVPLIPLQASSAEEHPAPPRGWGPDYEYASGHRFVVSNPDHPVADCLLDKEGQWLSVAYRGDEVRKIIESSYEDFLELSAEPKDGRRSLYFSWLSRLLLVKAKGFRDEREMRITYSLVAPDWKFLFYRSTPWGITPYIKLTAAPEAHDLSLAFGGSGDDFAQAAAKLPIKHIRMGPTPYRKAAKKALRQLLERHGYSDVEISASNIPYR